MTNLTYAGIGSRKTPTHVLTWMTSIAQRLAGYGYTLRSGGAEGADRAFEAGSLLKEIYTPRSVGVNWDRAFSTVTNFHPAPARLSSYARLLMARNAFQVLGPQCDDQSKFVVCWTPDGAETHTSRLTGGTGQAIRIANYYDIPVVNLANHDAADRLYELVFGEEEILA